MHCYQPGCTREGKHKTFRRLRIGGDLGGSITGVPHWWCDRHKPQD